MWPAVIWQNIFHSLWSLVTMLPQIASSEYGQNPESSLKSCKPNQILTLGTTFPFSSGRTLWIVLNTSWWSTSFMCREGCKQPARPPSGQEWFYPESFSLSWKARINKALLFVWFVDLRTYRWNWNKGLYGCAFTMESDKKYHKTGAKLMACSRQVGDRNGKNSLSASWGNASSPAVCCIKTKPLVTKTASNQKF